jgi:hypothetical protein
MNADNVENNGIKDSKRDRERKKERKKTKTVTPMQLLIPQTPHYMVKFETQVCFVRGI